MAEELTFDLAEVMERASKLPISGGRATHAVVTFPNLKLFVIYMPAESVRSEHSTPGRIAVQVLRGHIRMNTRDANYELTAGREAAFDSNVSMRFTRLRIRGFYSPWRQELKHEGNAGGDGIVFHVVATAPKH